MSRPGGRVRSWGSCSGGWKEQGRGFEFTGSEPQDINCSLLLPLRDWTGLLRSSCCGHQDTCLSRCLEEEGHADKHGAVESGSRVRSCLDQTVPVRDTYVARGCNHGVPGRPALMFCPLLQNLTILTCQQKAKAIPHFSRSVPYSWAIYCFPFLMRTKHTLVTILTQAFPSFGLFP